ncbi:hypothetical protein ACEWY4_018208 [Coilia grayii]|uniref:G-protein coupled receptors family 1 profile domain-containing protein n=1 Tax=Coilia grayii TaxID=363190 RepID=A0ABD1JJ71_9TELE
MNSSRYVIPFSVDFSHPEDYFIFMFHVLFATSVALFAGSVIIGILATSSLLRQNRFIFMLNTSISDTLTGLSVYYLGLFDVQEGYPSRNGTYHLLPSLLGVNIMTFMFAQFDRYFAVCHPFFYGRFISRPFVTVVCIYCWFHVYTQILIQNIVPVSKAVQIYTFSIISLQIIVVTKVAMTIKLYIVARFQLARDPPGEERENKKESLRIIIIVVICFLILWCPSFVNIIIRQTTPYGLLSRNEATNLFAIMARFNALTTPALYVWASPALRTAVLRAVWWKVLSKNTVRIDFVKHAPYSRKP